MIGLLERAEQEAKKSLMKFKVGAVIWTDKEHGVGDTFEDRFIAAGFNRKGTSYSGSVHAEIAAVIEVIKSGWGIEAFPNCSILVVRTMKNGKRSLAKPCDNCMAVLTELGFKEIIYSLDDKRFGHLFKPKGSNMYKEVLQEKEVWE